MKRMWAVWGVAAAVFATSSAWAQAEEVPSGEGEPTRSAEPEPEAAPRRAGPHTAGALQLGVGFRYGAEVSDGDLNPWAFWQYASTGR